MKKPLHILLGAGFGLLVLSSYANGPFAGGAGNRTGSAGTTANCTGSGCHVANDASYTVSIKLLLNGSQVSSYQVGKTYQVLLTGIAPGTTRTRFGFQLSSVIAASTSTQAGTLGTTGRPGVALRGSSLQLVEHSTPLTGQNVSGSYVDTVTVNWTPGSSLGTVRFYATMNAVNNNGSTSGDLPNATTLDIAEAPPTGVASVSTGLIGVYPNPATSVLHVPLEAGTSDLSILDATGRLILSQKFHVQGSQTESVNIEKLTSGQYFLHVSRNGTMHAVPFTKL